MKKILLLLSFFSLFSGVIWAENMKTLGNMDVHYIAIGSTFLTPEIAKTYGIQRSKYNSLINISVMDNQQQGKPAKAVKITGQARNNLGQMKTLDFNEVKEGNAIYYLAQVRFSNDETMHFEIKINDGKEQQILKFTQKFYVD